MLPGQLIQGQKARRGGGRAIDRLFEGKAGVGLIMPIQNWFQLGTGPGGPVQVPACNRFYFFYSFQPSGRKWDVIRTQGQSIGGRVQELGRVLRALSGRRTTSVWFKLTTALHVPHPPAGKRRRNIFEEKGMAQD